MAIAVLSGDLGPFKQFFRILEIIAGIIFSPRIILRIIPMGEELLSVQIALFR